MGSKHSKPTTSNNAHGAAPRNTISNYSDQMLSDIIWYIEAFSQTIEYGSTSIFHRDSCESRKLKITNQLLLAVAYGMESKDANISIKPSDTANLFKSHLYAKDLLQKSPEFLLSRGYVTDWAGRTFKGRITLENPKGEGITAFQYALWAKDFKMVEMMLSCIPVTPEGDVIWEALFEQAKQVKAPIEAGGGLTYTHTYNSPKLDSHGIPDGTISSVTEKRTENHFDITPLCKAYEYYNSNIAGHMLPPGQNLYWTKLIGTLQHLLPVHVLQRYCDPKRQFSKRSEFKRAFKRSIYFFNWNTSSDSSLFGSTLSSDFALMRARARKCGGRDKAVALADTALDLAAIRRLDEVSTNKMEKMTEQFLLPRRGARVRP